jgi:hypothetical protein
MSKAGWMILALLTAAVFPSGLAAQDAAARWLPGILAADPQPHGCVDCHVNVGDKVPAKLNVMLSKLPKHPKVDAIIKVAPTDCTMCHKEGAKMGTIYQVVHKAHFAKKADSQFIKLYDGACLHCHTMDLDTGIVGIKSGPKNW